VFDPQVKVGDEIIVLEVADIDGRGNESKQPEKYIRYFVTKIYHGDEFHRHPFNQTYYGLNRPDVDVTDPERPGVYDKSSIHKYLFPADTWILNPKGPTMRYEDAFDNSFLYEHEESKRYISHSYEPSVVNFTLDNFMRVTKKNFRDVNNDIDDLSTEVKGTIRKLKQSISDNFKKGDSLTKTMDQLTPINEHETKKVLNPDVVKGDVIELIYMDDPWSPVPPATKGIVIGFMSTHGENEKILVKWIKSTDNLEQPEFQDVPILKDRDVYRLANPKELKSDNEEDMQEDDDMDEATGASSAGGYSAPLFGKFTSKSENEPKKSIKLHNFFEGTAQIIRRRKLTEALEPDWSIRRGRQHYAMNQPSGSGEPVAAFNDYLVKNSPFNYMGFDYYLSAVPSRMPETARIDIFVPMLDTGHNADKLWDGTNIVTYTMDEEEVYDPNYYDDPEENYRVEDVYKRVERPRHLISHHEKYPQHCGHLHYVHLLLDGRL
jgi:hypothetical protein